MHIDVTILTRDVNGIRSGHYFPWDEAHEYIPEHINAEDEILVVMAGDVLLYSSLGNDPITIDDLTGFFA